MQNVQWKKVNPYNNTLEMRIESDMFVISLWILFS